MSHGIEWEVSPYSPISSSHRAYLGLPFLDPLRELPLWPLDLINPSFSPIFTQPRPSGLIFIMTTIYWATQLSVAKSRGKPRFVLWDSKPKPLTTTLLLVAWRFLGPVHPILTLGYPSISTEIICREVLTWMLVCGQKEILVHCQWKYKLM